jgi:hypothetical protein
MMDKTMCEVLWRNISDFYVNLWVAVGKHPQVILAMYFYLGQEQKDACKRNLCYIYSFVWFWNIVDHWFKQEKGKKVVGEFYLWILQLNKCCVSTV